MLFSSLTFTLCFLPLTLLVYYYCPIIKARNYFLLTASLVFYAWGEPKYVLIMLVSILANYRVGILLGNTAHSKTARCVILAAGIGINLLLLFYFKYFMFAERVINKILRMITLPPFQIPLLNISLPIGISFYTFQSVSYLVDVYKQPALVQNNLLHLGLYISFFPQLIAGPIVRYHDISHQIRERSHSITLFAQGAERFITGLAKKVLIANTMAAMADKIMTFPSQSVLWYFLVLAIVCYTFQIYYDFSGYSDMAIGLGKMFGFTILENFDYPYAAKSITEFWHRWHISLSSWFKDYLYIPLGGNRKGKIQTTINLFIVFFTTGLWHGAAFHFVFWGLGHGTLLFIEKTGGKKVASLIKNRNAAALLGHIYTLAAVITLWVFFRLGMGESLRFFQAIFALNRGSENFTLFIKDGIDAPFALSLAAAALFAVPWWRKIPLEITFPAPFCAAFRCLLLILSLCVLASGAYNPFIYFRF